MACRRADGPRVWRLLSGATSPQNERNSECVGGAWVGAMSQTGRPNTFKSGRKGEGADQANAVSA